MAYEKRPEVLEGAPLHYAPENELGVVFLFSHLAKKWRVKVEQIRAKYPDCIAYQKKQKELKSRCSTSRQAPCHIKYGGYY